MKMRDSTDLSSQEGKRKEKGEAKGSLRCESYRPHSLRDLYDSILLGSV